jgi:hypothetical protein
VGQLTKLCELGGEGGEEQRLRAGVGDKLTSQSGAWQIAELIL